MANYDVKQEVTDKFSLRGRVFHKIRDDILSGKYKDNEELCEKIEDTMIQMAEDILNIIQNKFLNTFILMCISIKKTQ